MDSNGLRIRFAAILVISGLAQPVLADRDLAYQESVKVTPLLKTTRDAGGKPIVYPGGKDAEVTGIMVEIPAGGETGWHIHTVPCFAYVLEGEVHVEMENGRTNVFKAGEAIAEAVALRHNGRNRGSVPAKIVFFAAGTHGQPFTVKKP